MELFITAATSLTNILLGIFVLARNRKSTVNVTFFFTTIFIALWIVSLYIFYLPYGPSLVLSLGRFNFVAIIFLMATLFHFIYLFPRPLTSRSKLTIIAPIYIVATVLSFLTQFTDLIIRDEVIVATERLTNFGKLFIIFDIYFLLITGGFLLIFFIKFYKNKKGQIRSQLRFLTLGIITTIIVGSLTNLILPIIFNNEAFIKAGPLSTVFFVFCTSYAIVKHRLMDIRMVVARSVTYIILLTTLAAIYAGSVLGLERLIFPNASNDFSLLEGGMRTVIAVVMVFIFQPIKAWITNATDAIFFKNRYDVEEVLNELSHTISSTIILVEMLYKVNDILVNNLKLSRSAFVIFKNETEAYTSQAIGYKGWPPVDVPDFYHLSKKGILVYDELEEGSTYKRLLRKYDAGVAVPIKLEGELVGIYLAGEKNSGDMFNQQDIEVFDTLAPEIAIAVQNAKSYEEISRFNVTLRQEVKRATHRLKDKNEQLKQLDKAKDEFISMASHQLRTPLTAIKGYLSMLLEGDAGEIKVSQYDFINEAYSAAGRMVGLINDLLNVSRMDTGRFFLEPKEVDIEKMVNEEVKQLQNHAKEKGIYLNIENKGKIPTIFADETKIRQVVMNFIDNAIYYTQKGGVTVVMQKEKDELVFKVHDTGIGVPKEQWGHLFEKFFRADNARQTRPDGTGLGIYLAKRVVEDHGGKVIFDSTVGKGSVFGFRFPLKKKLPTNVPSTPLTNHPAAPALTSASATFTEKAVGLEPPIKK